MHFRPNRVRCILALSLSLIVGTTLSGCGLLGQKKPTKTELAMKDTATGCLNDMAANIQSYLEGEIETQKWQETVDCAIKAHEDFRKNIRGSIPEAYSQEDMLAFVNEILITKGEPVSAELVDMTFALKASLFGGDSQSLTYGELDRLIEVFKMVREESISLIPHLANRARKPTTAQMTAFVDAVGKFGEKLSTSFHTEKNQPFYVDQAIRLVDEFSKMLGVRISTDSIPGVFSIIALITNGRSDGISGIMWPRLIRLGSVLGGVTAAGSAIAASKLDGPNEYGEFLYSLSKRVRIVLDQVVEWNGSKIETSKLQWVLDQVPSSWTMGISKSALAASLEPVIRRIFQTSSFDRQALDTVFSLADNWVRGQTHLERIFKNYNLSPEGVTTEQFTSSALQYYQGLSPTGQQDVLRLVYLATRFPPMFRNGAMRITFERSYNHSLTNLANIHWAELAARHLIKGFSSIQDKTLAVEIDVKTIFTEFEELLLATKLLDKSLPAEYYQKLYRKHFRQANLFTYVGNGDGFLDVDEVTNYFLVIFSTTDLSNRIRSEIEPRCSYSDGRKDPLSWLWMEVTCFREQFYGQTQFWSDFPLMLAHYQSLNSSDRQKLKGAMEYGARRVNYKDADDIGSNDVAGFAGILHFIEAVFLRFDQNMDQHLDRDDAIRAYPIFKKIIVDISNGELSWNDDDKAKAVFTYLLKHGHPPGQLPKRADGSDPTWLETTADLANFLLWWKLGPSTWNMNVDRSSVYQILKFF